MDLKSKFVTLVVTSEWLLKMSDWYVMQSKPQKERFLYVQLNLHQIETYLPLVKFQDSKGHINTKPFFPGYLFINLDLLEIGTALLQWMPGSIGIVSFGGQPAIIPDHVINQLKQKLHRLCLDELTSNLQKASRGDSVSINVGPLKGYQAIFDEYLPEKDRVRLFLKALSDNAFSVEIPAAYVAV